MALRLQMNPQSNGCAAEAERRAGDTLNTSLVDVVAVSNALGRLEHCALLLGSQPTYSTLRELDQAVIVLSNYMAMDDLCLPVACFEETVFRACRMVAQRQSAFLRRQYSALATFPPKGAKESTAWWERLIAASYQAQDYVDRVTFKWIERRRDYRLNIATWLGPHQNSSRIALQDLRKLDTLDEVERMLYRGVASSHRVIATACEMFLAALRIDVDVNVVERARQVAHQHARSLGV